MKVPYSMNVDGNLTMRGTSATITSAGAATFQSVSAYTYLGLNLSTGVEDFVAPTAIYNTDGSISISAAKINMYDNATYQGAIVTYQVAGATLTLTDGLQQYIVADYNSGNPIYRIESNKANINSSNIIGIRVVWRQGTNVHSTDFDSAGINLANKIDRSILETTPYRISRDGGLVLSETSSPAVRTILITSAVVYGGTVPHLVSAYNSSTDTFTLVNHVAGVWNYTSGTIQYNNTQYDDGTNLQTIPNNKYSIRWIYRTIGTSKEVFQVLGTSYYNSIELARLEKERSDLPDLVKGHGFLVGRIIVQYNAASGIVENVTTTTFGTAQVQNHNDLNNIQGGDATGYYHLTSAQNNYISNVSADIQTQLNNRLPLSGGVLTGNISGTYATFSGNLTANFLYGKSQYINIAQNSVAAADYSIPYIGTPSTGDIFYSSANGITLNPSTGEFKVKTIIENGQTLSSRYLPISGGPMYGAITMSTSETISSTELTKTGFSFGGYHGITKFTGGNAATIPGGVGATDGPFIYGYGGVALGFIQGNTSAYSLSAALKTNGLNVFIAGLLTAPTISTTAITATGSITINANYPLRFTYGGVSNYYLATDTNGIYLAIFSSANAGKSIFLETYDTDIFHRKNGTNYAILDKSNYITTIGTASSTTSGALTSSDWSLFNSKLDPATASSIYLPLSGGTLTGNISAGSNSIYFGNASLHKSGDSNWIHVGTSGFLPDTNLVQSLGIAAYQFATIYGGTIYEGSSALSSKYLGITAASTTYLGINAAAASSNFLNKNSAFKSSGEAGVQYYDADFTPIGTSANYNGFQGPTTAWYQVIHMPLSVGNYFNELLFPVNDTAGLWWRQRRNASYYGWFKILDSQNFMSYALPLTGGTLTGPVSGTSISATNFYGNFNGPIASAPYLPLSGGTLTGGLIGTTATFGNAGIASTTGQTAAWFGYNGLNNGTSTPYGFNQWVDGGLVMGIPSTKSAFFHVAGTSILSLSLGNVYVTGNLSASSNVIAGNASIATYSQNAAFAWFGKNGNNSAIWSNFAGVISDGTSTYIGGISNGAIPLIIGGTTMASVTSGGITVLAGGVTISAGGINLYPSGGGVKFANGTWNDVGDDVQFGDINEGGVLGFRRSASTQTSYIRFGATGAGAGGYLFGFDGSSLYAGGPLTVNGSISTNGFTNSFFKDITPTTASNTNYSSAPLQIVRVTNSGSNTSIAAGIGFHNQGYNGAFLYYDPASSVFMYNRHIAGSLVTMWDSSNLTPTSISNWNNAIENSFQTGSGTSARCVQIGYYSLNSTSYNQHRQSIMISSRVGNATIYLSLDTFGTSGSLDNTVVGFGTNHNIVIKRVIGTSTTTWTVYHITTVYDNFVKYKFGTVTSLGSTYNNTVSDSTYVDGVSNVTDVTINWYGPNMVTNGPATIGLAGIGTWANNNWAWMGYKSLNAAAWSGFMQNSTGRTLLGSVAGQTVGLYVGQASVLECSSSEISANYPIKVSTPGVGIYAVGNSYQSIRIESTVANNAAYMSFKSSSNSSGAWDIGKIDNSDGGTLPGYFYIYDGTAGTTNAKVPFSIIPGATGAANFNRTVNVIGTIDNTLSITTNYSAQYTHAIMALNPNLTTTNKNYHIVIGATGSTANAAYFGFRYDGGAGSTGNKLTMGIWSYNDLLTIGTDGAARFNTGGAGSDNMLGSVYAANATFSGSMIVGNASLGTYANPAALSFAWFGKNGTNPTTGNLAGMITNGVDTYVGAANGTGSLFLSVSGTTIAFLTSGGFTATRLNGGLDYSWVDGRTKDMASVFNRIDSGWYQQSQTYKANGWPEDSGWWHLMSSTHNNGSNYYALQIAADFYAQDFRIRSTNGSGATSWSTIATLQKNNVWTGTNTFGNVTATNFSGTFTGSINGYSTQTDALSVWDAGTRKTPGHSLGSGTRSGTLAPNTYATGIFFEFKNGYFGSGRYQGLMTIAPWQGTIGSTGDVNYQLLFDPTVADTVTRPIMKLRAGIDTTWGTFFNFGMLEYDNTWTGTNAFANISANYGYFNRIYFQSSCQNGLFWPHGDVSLTWQSNNGSLSVYQISNTGSGQLNFGYGTGNYISAPNSSMLGIYGAGSTETIVPGNMLLKCNSGSMTLYAGGNVQVTNAATVTFAAGSLFSVTANLFSVTAINSTINGNIYNYGTEANFANNTLVVTSASYSAKIGGYTGYYAHIMQGGAGAAWMNYGSYGRSGIGAYNGYCIDATNGRLALGVGIGYAAMDVTSASSTEHLIQLFSRFKFAAISLGGNVTANNTYQGKLIDLSARILTMDTASISAGFWCYICGAGTITSTASYYVRGANVNANQSVSFFGAAMAYYNGANWYVG